ncbi:MAG: Uma2 family endonuclease [Ilumatobacteraceae bacterium]
MLAERRRNGQDVFDEWWEGSYRLVDVPAPEHGELIAELAGQLNGLVEMAGLHVAMLLNIGRDGWDARVADIGVYRPDTPRTSPAFLTTAVLVVEILSPGETAGEKLAFYAAWAVEEYLEVDLCGRSVRLLVRDGDRWEPAETSPALGFSLGDLVIDWP